MNWFFYAIIYAFVRSIMGTGWWRWEIEGLEKLPPRAAGGMIIAMNHIHWIDIPAIGALLPYRYRPTWLAKSEMFANPLLGRWLRMMDVIAVNRSKRDLAVLYASERALQAGAVLMLFPEGHRSGHGKLQQGHNGAVRLAARTGALIVPVAIEGTQHGLGTVLRRKKVVVRVGQPYRLISDRGGKIRPDTMHRLTNDMMSRIAAMLPADLRGVYQGREPTDHTVAPSPG